MCHIFTPLMSIPSGSRLSRSLNISRSRSTRLEVKTGRFFTYPPQTFCAFSNAVNGNARGSIPPIDAKSTFDSAVFIPSSQPFLYTPPCFRMRNPSFVLDSHQSIFERKWDPGLACQRYVHPNSSSRKATRPHTWSESGSKRQVRVLQ